MRDALATDIGMPVEGGYELRRKAQAQEPERGGLVPALALTAYTRAEDARRALEADYQAHIPKPVEPSELATTEPKRKLGAAQSQVWMSHDFNDS